MNCLKYLIKNDLNNELDNLIIERFKLISSYDGQKCKGCGVIQGNSLKGFKKYYCKHLSARVDKKLKKEKEKITNKILGFTIVTVCQDTQVEA